MVRTSNATFKDRPRLTKTTKSYPVSIRLNKYLRSVFVGKFAKNFEENKELNEAEKNLNQLLNLDVLYQKTDILLCLGSFVSKFAGLLTIGLIGDLNYIPLIPLMFFFNEISMPTLRSLIVKQVKDDEKGKSIHFSMH